MKPTCSLLLMAAIVAAPAGDAFAQPARHQTPADPPPAAGSAPSWELGASVFGYFVPDDIDYASPILTADRGGLHLEGRYNYESLDTGSLFVGWTFSAGSTVEVEATAMVGGVFGDLDGVAPGYELTLAYRRLSFYSEGEWVVTGEDRSEDFTYTWSELDYSFADWLRGGLVLQHTRAYATGLAAQRGLLVGVSYRQVEFTAYVFNLGWETPTVVCALAASF